MKTISFCTVYIHKNISVNIWILIDINLISGKSTKSDHWKHNEYQFAHIQKFTFWDLLYHINLLIE